MGGEYFGTRWIIFWTQLCSRILFYLKNEKSSRSIFISFLLFELDVRIFLFGSCCLKEKIWKPVFVLQTQFFDFIFPNFGRFCGLLFFSGHSDYPRFFSNVQFFFRISWFSGISEQPRFFSDHHFFMEYKDFLESPGTPIFFKCAVFSTSYFFSGTTRARKFWETKTI